MNTVQGGGCIVAGIIRLEPARILGREFPMNYLNTLNLGQTKERKKERRQEKKKRREVILVEKVHVIFLIYITVG